MGGQGDWSATLVSISRAVHPGTAVNKSKIKALPLQIFFSLRQREKNSVNIEWCFGLPRVFTQFGHSSPQSLPASNSEPKRETDSHVLAQFLTYSQVLN
jgi:hypothetical protein